MTDDIMKRTREWLQSCVNAATRSGVPEEADLEAFILAHIDGEPARLAAAREEAIMAWRAGAADRDELRADCERRIAAAREEQREACALDAEERVGCASTYDEIRSVPLDATPLADELRTLRAKYDELHTAAGNWLRQRDLAFDREEEEEVRAQLRELREVAERNVADVQHLRQSSIALTDERDALRARVAELEAQLGGMTEQWKAELNHANAWMRKHQAAEAQVAAARAECERLIDRPWSRWAGDAGRDVLRAMDEAAKK